MVALVVFRIIQGLGAGSIQSMATTIVGDIYPAAERARVQGWLSSVWGFAAIAGPVLGALIVEHLHWAFVFWINLPIGVAAMAILMYSLDEHIEPRTHQIDFRGATLLIIGIGAILMPTIQAQYLSTTTSAVLLGASGRRAIACGSAIRPSRIRPGRLRSSPASTPWTKRSIARC